MLVVGVCVLSSVLISGETEVLKSRGACRSDVGRVSWQLLD